MVGGTHGVGRRQRRQRAPVCRVPGKIPTGSMAINRLLGYVMIALAAPAALALLAFVRLKQVGSSGSVLQFTSPSSR